MPGRAFFPNLSKFITSAAALLVLVSTPLVRSQGMKPGELQVDAFMGGMEEDLGLRLAQDKGGPSKGGFLNNMLFSLIIDYLCTHGIN